MTAIAQMCILGLMWVFGAFMFENGPIAVAYTFTILNSLQGALVFIMHCLLSKQVGYSSCVCVYACDWVCMYEAKRTEHIIKNSTTCVKCITTKTFDYNGICFSPLMFCCPLQVREEYANFLSCICTPQKKRYSDLSSTNPSSSQSQVSIK